MQTTYTLLASPCHKTQGISKPVAEGLARLGIENLQDILFHLPLRYIDQTHITPLRDIRPGDHVMLQGTITNQQQLYKPRLQLILQVTDGSHLCYIRLFYFNNKQKQQLKLGTRIVFYGEVRQGRYGLELVHPEYKTLDAHAIPETKNSYTPIYPTTERIGQITWRKLSDKVLQLLPPLDEGFELIPIQVRERFQLMALNEALMYVHRPPPTANLAALTEGKHPAQRRLAFEELLAHQLSLKLFRAKIQAYSALALTSNNQFIPIFLQQLPFQLTQAQRRVYEEIAQDLQHSKPMLRLVQGDVGSGKTVVAALAMLLAVENGYQAAIMAPTEILAEQHYQYLHDRLTPLGIKVGWLANKLTTKAKKTSLTAIEQGDYQIIVGTHALFQKQVNFAKLALVVIDEQHRFGVEQRLALRNKGKHEGQMPHQLIMTATPIPRTLAMTAYADLDSSMIDELPPGRKNIHTVVLSNDRRPEVIQKVQQACLRQCQVYWVCTLIDESEQMTIQAAESTAALLQQELGADIKVGLIHGRLAALEKEQMMQAFKAGDLHVLVATTVIEVGVDVPNASLMIIENAERLGLSQLHQLRGRVGRGSIESFCVLLYQGPLSYMAKSRLGIMRDTNDGFLIAEQDLNLRGPGEILGTRQTGVLQLRIANLQRDSHLLPEIQQAAHLFQQHYTSLIPLLIKRWLGSKEQFGSV